MYYKKACFLFKYNVVSGKMQHYIKIQDFKNQKFEENYFKENIKKTPESPASQLYISDVYN